MYFFNIKLAVLWITHDTIEERIIKLHVSLEEAIEKSQTRELSFGSSLFKLVAFNRS